MGKIKTQKSKQKKSQKGKLLMLFGAVMIFCSVYLAVSYNVEENSAKNSSAEIMSKIIEDNREETSEVISEETDKTDKTEDIIIIDGYEYIGYISIPSVELELPIMAQWDYDRLRIAPCLYYGSFKEGNMVIAGHSYSTGFGKLGQLKIGDKVIYTDANKNSHYYTVGDIEILAPTDTKLMIETDWELSLYTCTYSSTKRITIRCSLDRI